MGWRKCPRPEAYKCSQGPKIPLAAQALSNSVCLNYCFSVCLHWSGVVCLILLGRVGPQERFLWCWEGVYTPWDLRIKKVISRDRREEGQLCCGQPDVWWRGTLTVVMGSLHDWNESGTFSSTSPAQLLQWCMAQLSQAMDWKPHRKHGNMKKCGWQSMRAHPFPLASHWSLALVWEALGVPVQHTANKYELFFKTLLTSTSQVHHNQDDPLFTRLPFTVLGTRRGGTLSYLPTCSWAAQTWHHHLLLVHLSCCVVCRERPAQK